MRLLLSVMFGVCFTFAAQAAVKLTVCPFSPDEATEVSFSELPPPLLHIALENKYPPLPSSPENVFLPSFPATYLDINRDGFKDILVNIKHTDYCGSSGCMVNLYFGKADGKTYEPALHLFNAGSDEIFVSQESIDDHLPLLLKSKIHEREGVFYTYKWDGKKYKSNEICYLAD